MDIVFVNLPFVQLSQPSLALSILTSVVERSGYSSVVLYPNLQFSQAIGEKLYALIANYYPQTDLLLGEVLFSQYLNDIDASSSILNLISLARSGTRERLGDYISQLVSQRENIARFIDETARAVLDKRPKVIGLSSIFQQHTAALSLAKRLRELDDSVAILLGGSNCEGEMGAQTAASFNYVDFVFSGAGETSIIEVLKQLLDGAPITAVDGVFPTTRRPNHPQPNASYGAEPDLDSLPFPNFRDYFTAIQGIGSRLTGEVLLPFEGSRGCWWGVKNHCTFCGLNGRTMKMRQKSGPRVLAELRYLASQFPNGKITPVDNIMPNSYFDDVLPELARNPVGQIFFEVKANLKEEQLKLLHSAQVRELQPGIESLSDASLRRMRKGVSSLQNILLLRRSKEIGLKLFWNLLFGFPGEEITEYHEQLDIARSISHLPPPISAARVRVDRFSPLFSESEQFRIRNLRPVEAYNNIYPYLSEADRSRIAYYFDADYDERHAFATERVMLQSFVSVWRTSYPGAYLGLLENNNVSVLVDTRVGASTHAYIVDARDLFAFTLCRKILHVDDAVRSIEEHFPETDGFTILQRWISRGCILRIGSNVLSLVEEGVQSHELIAALALARERQGEEIVDRSFRSPIEIGHEPAL